MSTHLDSLLSQKKKIEELLEEFHSEIMNSIKNSIKNPTGRISFAELLNSYSQIHKILLDINKHEIEIPLKEIELIRKKEEIADLQKDKLSLFELQKIYNELKKLNELQLSENEQIIK